MRFQIGIGLVSISLIALQIGLTRIFSNMIWYHLSFLTISLTMLGFSFSGLILLGFPSLARPAGQRTVPICASLFATTVGLGTLYIFLKPGIVGFLQTGVGLVHLAPALYFLVLLAIFLLAFLFAGLTISTAITQHAAKVGRVYFANLLGSGLGCLVVIAALSQLGAFKTVLIIVALAALGALAFGGLYRASRVCFGLNAVSLLAALTAFVAMSDDTIFARSLFTRYDVTDENRIYREWNSFSVVDFYEPDEENEEAYYEGLWGLSPAYQGERLDPIKVIIDSWAITSINKVDEGTLELELFDYLPSNLAYQLVETPEVMIVGAGGGLDVLAALHYDARRVRAIEINPSIVKAVKTRFAEYAGGIYDHPRVEAVVGEGRHVINGDGRTYDMIQLSGVDTLSGAQASSYSFSESYLYTRQAFDEYLDHLKPGGIVTFMRFAFEKPREMLRLLTTAAEVLRDRGVVDVGRHVVLVHSNQHVFATMLLKESPFTDDELGRLEEVVERNGFRFLYHPTRSVGGEYEEFLASSDWAQFYDAYPYRVSPVSDDNPFFFNYTKAGDLVRIPDSQVYWLYWLGQTILFYGAGLVLLLGTVFIGIPLLSLRRSREATPAKHRFMAYFLCLGLAFMFVEILLMQRFTLFLGQPIYSLTLVIFSLLVFAGLGSNVSQRIAEPRPRTLLIIFASLITALFTTYLCTELVFDALLHESIAVRASASVILLAPPSFLMGMPFPLGVRIANQRSPRMVPWGWAVNGYGSVLGSFLSVALAIVFGLTAVYTIACALYAVGALLIVSCVRSGGAELQEAG